MPKFKVYLERTETSVAYVEADSAEEAEEIADSDDFDYSEFKEIDGSMNSVILFGEAEEIEETNSQK